MTQLPGGSPIVPPPSEVILQPLIPMGGWSRKPGIATIPRQRRRLPNRLPLRVLLLALLCLIATPAGAEPIPMCGELAQSIEAPPPLYPTTDAALTQTPCSQQGPLAFWDEASLPPHPDEPRTLDDPLGYLQGGKLPRASSIRLPLQRAATLRLPRGARREVERPPRPAAVQLP